MTIRTSRSLPVAETSPPPPFPLVGAHFGAAFGWAMLGGVALIWLAPTLAQGVFLDPRLLGTTHLFTLGWLTTVITGVLYQIFPAMLGVSARSLRVARFSLIAHNLGVILLVSGLLTGRALVQSAGWAALFTAVFGTAWNLLPQRRKAQRNRQLGIYISYAHMGFGLAIAIAGVRIGDGLGWWTTPRLGLLAAHFHFAAVGFATMTAFGVGGQMLPMFLGVVGRPPVLLGWLPRILASGTVVFAIGTIAGQPGATWLGAGLMAAATVGFLGLAVRWFRGRNRRGLDPTTALLLSALIWLGLAVVLGLVALVRGPINPGVIISYAVLILLGWLTGMILGVSFRVLPTLIWHHRFAAQRPRPGAPTQAEMVVPALGWATLAMHASGILLLVLGMVDSSPIQVRGGAILFTASILVTISHHLRLLLIGRGGSTNRAGAASG